MKKVALQAGILVLAVMFGLPCAYAEKAKVVLLITEQNIEGPQRAWWASEIDLSTAEAAVAEQLLREGYTVLEPLGLRKVVKQDKAFRMVEMAEDKSVRLGSLSGADYVVVGKAIASSGGNVPQSNMRSCFANITARLIRVKYSLVVAYLDSTGSSAHLDVITGGKEALRNAGQDLAAKIIEALKKKEGGK